jgi:hypothetical protein
MQFLRSVCRLIVTANVVPNSPNLVTLMMESLRSTEMSVLTRGIRHNVQEVDIIFTRFFSLKNFMSRKPVGKYFTILPSWLNNRLSLSSSWRMQDYGIISWSKTSKSTLMIPKNFSLCEDYSLRQRCLIILCMKSTNNNKLHRLTFKLIE